MALEHSLGQRVGAKLVFALLDAACLWAIIKITPTICINLLWFDLHSCQTGCYFKGCFTVEQRCFAHNTVVAGDALLVYRT